MAHDVLRPNAEMTKTHSTLSQQSLALVGFLLASACASYPPPTDTLADAIATARGAEEVGAAEVPQAALALQLAREEIAKARSLIADGENERAYFQALKAANDAELALALVREVKAREQAELAAEQLKDVESKAPETMGSSEEMEMGVEP